MLDSGLDLNVAADICHPARNSLAGDIDECGQAGIRADHGTSATDDISSLRSALRGRTQGQDLARSLIGIARRLYAEEPFGVDLKETV